jgi:hypothetical protein
MEKYVFKTVINAPKEKVWDILWNNVTYPKWTAAFAEGSRAESDWKKGSRILFLDTTGSGMVATIAAKKENEFMSFQHQGMIRDGVEDLDSPKVKEWQGTLENYTLKTVDGKTELTVEMDIMDAYKDYFLKTWPEALQLVKQLAEQG